MSRINRRQYSEDYVRPTLPESYVLVGRGADLDRHFRNGIQLWPGMCHSVYERHYHWQAGLQLSYCNPDFYYAVNANDEDTIQSIYKELKLPVLAPYCEQGGETVPNYEF